MYCRGELLWNIHRITIIFDKLDKLEIESNFMGEKKVDIRSPGVY